MRFYNPGDEIYMFGFSRGAYIARFLAEMLDYIGLLSHGNEEMVKFAWKAFAQWQCRQQSVGTDEEVAALDAEKRKMYHFMKGFRETFSRPVGRIRFLGLFDTVNSVPRFETAWMQRSKFPYTARSSAKVIRHAVSIDERRAKFRQDLMYQGNPKVRDHHHRLRRRHHINHWFGWEYFNLYNNVIPDKIKTEDQTEKKLEAAEVESAAPASAITFEQSQVPPEQRQQSDVAPSSEPKRHEERGRRRAATFLSPEGGIQPRGRRSSEAQQRRGSEAQRRGSTAQPRGSEAEFTPYRARSASRRRPASQQQQQRWQSEPHASRAPSEVGTDISGLAPSEIDPDWDEDGQDIDEVWFSGGHADIGGGWEMLDDRKSASHVPLAWIVREAMRAGLPFDADKVAEMGCACAAEWDEHNPSKRPVELKRQQRQQQKRKAKKTQDKPNIPDIRMANGGDPHFAESPPVSLDDDDDVSPTRKVFPTSSSIASSDDSGSDSDSDDEHETNFHGLMSRANTARIHDSLAYGGGLGTIAVTAWKFMEYLPFRRMDLKGDGSWEPIRWPLPRGEVRDVPNNVRVHGSVIRRMQEDESYRPGNLIIGGGGRGVRRAPAEYGIGEWVCVADKGDPIGEIWVRKNPPEITLEGSKKG